MNRPFLARFGVLLLAAAILTVACDQSTPSASPTTAPTGTPAPTGAPTPSGEASPEPSQDADAIYDAIEEQVLALRGLPPVDVERLTIGEDELLRMMTERFDADYPESYVLANERLYKALGLMDEGASLRSLYLDLLAGAVAGFYRPDTKALYVVARSGTVGAADKFTFAHEYTHALQDAAFTIFEDQDAYLDQSDEALGRAGLSEGDASLLSGQWAQAGHLSIDELTELAQTAFDPETAALLERTPAILVDPLTFPYTFGLVFLNSLFAAGGWAAIDAAYERPPQSTEQILHPEKYDAAETPIEVSLPADLADRMGEGWTVALQDTFGEFQTRVWLIESDLSVAAATEAAAGWGGDRLAVLDGPGDAWAVVVDTTWDSAEDADAFRAAAEEAIGSLGEAAVVGNASDATILIASDRDALLALDVIFGDTGA